MYVFDSHATFQAPKDTYLYNIIPVGNGIGAISSDNSLRLFDPDHLDTPISTIKNVNKDVTCIESLGEGGAEVICTAGRDGRICVWDPRTSQRVAEMGIGESDLVV